MAIYTLINKNQLQSLLAYYNLGELIEFFPIKSGTTNSNYEIIVNLNNQEIKYVVTIIEQNLTRASLLFCLEFAHSLRANHMPVANSVRDRHAMSYGLFVNKPFIITPFLDGESLSYEQNPPQSDHCSYMGLAIANMHIIGHQFKYRRSNPADINWCLKTFDNLADLIPADMKSLIMDEIQYLRVNQSLLENVDLVTGAIHADLFMDNVLFANHKLIGIIDFYYSCTDYLLYDLAIVVNDWAISPEGIFNRPNYISLITNYMSSLKKDALVYDNIVDNLTQRPIIWQFFLRQASLRFLLLRLSAQYIPIDSTLKTVKDPIEYQHKILFHRENDLSLI